MCKFAKGDLVKFTPDAFCYKVDGKVFKVDLHGVIGRIDNITANGYGVYFRVDGKDYKYEFPSFELIGVTDNVVNRSHVAGQTSVELNNDGLFMEFDDGTMYDFKGERYRPGVKGISEETAQELIDRVNAIRSHVSPFELFDNIIDKWKIDPNRYSLRVDLGNVYPKMPESESKPESKMTKERCIKLLEAYRAEREKIAKGRKFERCLRACVVDEALEKAIELLKGGMS